MARETLGTKLSEIEKKLGGTGEMPPAGTYDPLLWHLDRIESLIGGGSQSWSPYTLNYTFDEIWNTFMDGSDEEQEAIKSEFLDMVGTITEMVSPLDCIYFEINTKDKCVFKMSFCIPTGESVTFGTHTFTFKDDKTIAVNLLYEIDAETGEGRFTDAEFNLQD